MNRQRFYNLAVAGIRLQGGPALTDDDFTCKYRTGEGLACAVGQNIPDSVYTEDLEGSMPTHPASDISVTCGLETVDDCRFAAAIQRAHDNAVKDVFSSFRKVDFMTGFLNRAQQVAVDFQLNNWTTRAPLWVLRLYNRIYGVHHS